MNSIFVTSHIEIALIPGDRIVTYAGIVVDHRPQKEDPLGRWWAVILSKDVTQEN